MLLSKIMTGFHNYERKWICQFNRDLDIYSFAFLSETTNFESNILYFGTISELPKIPPQIHLTLLCIEDEDLPAVYGDKSITNLNLITLDKGTKSLEILKILTNMFGDAARISSGRSHLIEVLHSNQGLQAIIDKAYDILQNPIIVVDSSYKILAMYQDPHIAGDRTDLEEQRSLGYMLPSNIEAMHRAKVYEQTRIARYPFYNKDPKASHGWITALIYIHGIEVGQIGVMDSSHPFTEVDFELIDFLCKIISLELQKSDFYRTNQGLMHSYFLSDLLDNKVHDGAAIEQRMINLGWKLTSNLHIMLISDLAKNFFDGKAQLITSQLHSLLPSSRWVIYHGQIVFLLSSDTPKIFDETEALYHYLEINHLTASISNSFDSILDIRKNYLQAVKAQTFGQRFHPQERIHSYSDYMFHHMGEIVSEKYPLADFYHPGIVAIQDYDKAHNTNFLETLKLYLIHIDNPGAIAKELYIHKNTVFYRIAKLKEQFHLNLDDGDERFKIHLTIKLMEMES